MPYQRHTLHELPGREQWAQDEQVLHARQTPKGLHAAISTEGLAAQHDASALGIIAKTDARTMVAPTEKNNAVCFMSPYIGI